MKSLSFIFIFLFLIQLAYSSDHDKLIRIFINSEKDAELVHNYHLNHSQSVDLWNSPIPNKKILAQFQHDTLPAFLELADKNFIRVEIANNNITQVFEKNIQENKRKHLLRQQIFMSIDEKDRVESFNLDDYHSYDEIVEYLKSLEKRSSSLSIRLIQFGQTEEERQLYSLVISKKPTNRDNVLLFECNVHAREWVSGAACLKIIDKFVVHPDQTATKILETYDVHVIPILNPDGFEYSRLHVRSWRKNRAKNVKFFPLCKGTDVNRNFDVDFGGAGVSTMNPCSLIYCGKTAFSEKESKALRDYALALGPSLQAYISLHSFSQLLMYPFGYKKELIENDQELRRLTILAAEAIQAKQGEIYKTGPIYTTIYPASGSTLDWMQLNTNCKYNFVFEMRDTGEFGFMLPPELIQPAFQDVWIGVHQLILNIEK